jgi:hypothetical protein
MDEGDGFRTTPTPRQNPLLSFAREHVTLLASVMAALIFTIRCTIVSEGDFYTASILVGQTSIGDAIRALLFPVVPILLILGSWIAGVAAGNRRRWREPATLGLVAISAAGWFIAYYLLGLLNTGLNQTVIAVLAFGPTILTVLFRDYQTSFRPIVRSGTRGQWLFYHLLNLLMAGTLALVFIPPTARAVRTAFGADAFWLPRERLDFQREAPFTGYVLKDSGDRLVILNDNPRVIIEKDKTTLEDRDFCYPEPTDVEHVSEKVQSNLPACP